MAAVLNFGELIRPDPRSRRTLKNAAAQRFYTRYNTLRDSDDRVLAGGGELVSARFSNGMWLDVGMFAGPNEVQLYNPADPDNIRKMSYEDGFAEASQLDMTSATVEFDRMVLNPDVLYQLLDENLIAHAWYSTYPQSSTLLSSDTDRHRSSVCKRVCSTSSWDDWYIVKTSVTYRYLRPPPED